MSKKILVGNLPSTATSEDLSRRFEKFGVVESVDVAPDTSTAQSRSSGLVEMGSDSETKAAINALDLTKFGDLRISVRAAPGEDTA
jgi:RNA recognition motif-containing protein